MKILRSNPVLFVNEILERNMKQAYKQLLEKRHVESNKKIRSRLKDSVGKHFGEITQMAHPNGSILENFKP